MNYQEMMPIETVFKLIRDSDMTLDEFEDWVSDQRADAFDKGVHAGQGSY